VVGSVSCAVTALSAVLRRREAAEEVQLGFAILVMASLSTADGDRGESTRTGGASARLCGGAVQERQRGDVGWRKG
jgi:hypothetical protein